MRLPPCDPLRELDPELQQAVRWACARAQEWYHRFCPHHLCLQEWEQDALQIAVIAVWQASQQYKEGTPLSRKAFCALCAERALWKEWCKECEWAQHTQSNEVYDAENGEWTTQELEDPKAQEEIEESALCAQVREALARLEALHRAVVEGHYGEGLSEREIAKRLGKSKSWVHRRLEEALRKLGEFLGQKVEK